jgi:hypothetical protein
MITRRILCVGLGSTILGWITKAFLIVGNSEHKLPYALRLITADMTTLRADVDTETGDDFLAYAQGQFEFFESVSRSPLSQPRVETPTSFPLS